MKIPLPPALGATTAQHLDFAARVYAELEDEIRRLETPGVGFRFQWPFARWDKRYSVTLTAFMCFGCTNVHRAVDVVDEHGCEIEDELEREFHRELGVRGWLA